MNVNKAITIIIYLFVITSAVFYVLDEIRGLRTSWEKTYAEQYLTQQEDANDLAMQNAKTRLESEYGSLSDEEKNSLKQRYPTVPVGAGGDYVTYLKDKYVQEGITLLKEQINKEATKDAMQKFSEFTFADKAELFAKLEIDNAQNRLDAVLMVVIIWFIYWGFFSSMLGSSPFFKKFGASSLISFLLAVMIIKTKFTYSWTLTFINIVTWAGAISIVLLVVLGFLQIAFISVVGKYLGSFFSGVRKESQKISEEADKTAMLVGAGKDALKKVGDKIVGLKDIE